MKKVALALLTVVILLLPCISQADGRELIIEDFEDTSLPADELFLPEDLTDWGIMPPDSMEYSAEGAQNGNGLLAVFGESGGTHDAHARRNLKALFVGRLRENEPPRIRIVPR